MEMETSWLKSDDASDFKIDRGDEMTSTNSESREGKKLSRRLARPTFFL